MSMCGRIVLTSAPHQLAEHFFLDMVPPAGEPRYNIAPGQQIAAVVPNPGSEGRLIRSFTWGLELPWAKGPQPGPKLINARSETVLDKPAFAEAFRQRRCLIPADGFYEWQKRPTGPQPYYFRAKASGPLALAGIWSRQEYPGGHLVESCSILTTAANSLMRPVHHRMPVILPRGDWQFWLDMPEEKAESLLEMLRPLASDLLQSWPVDRRVNSTVFDQPECVVPIWDDRGGQLNLFS
jgi:putative SOS response-associated peptidase YedK